MVNKPKACEGCALYDRVVVPPTYGVPNGIMLVAQSPGDEEAKSGAVLIGRAGQLLNKVLAYVGLERKGMTLTNTLLCYEGRDIPNSEIDQAINKCRLNIDYVVGKVKPRLMIACGNYALKAILNKEGITSKRGRIFYSKRYKCPVVVTLHPAAVLRECTKEYPIKSYQNMSMREKAFIMDFQAVVTCIQKEVWKMGDQIPNDGLSLHPEQDSVNYHLYDPSELSAIQSANVLAVDIELDKGLEYDSKLYSLAISHTERSATVFFTPDKPTLELPQAITEKLQSPCDKVVAARPFDENILGENGVKMGGKIYDVLTMAHVLDENYHSYDLATIASLYAGIHNLKEAAEGYRFNLGEAPEQVVITYNGGDADATLRSFHVMRSKLQDQPRLWNYYQHFIIPVQDMLAVVAKNGCLVDRDVLSANIKEAETILAQLESEMIEYVPSEILAKHQGKLKFTRDAFVRDIVFGGLGMTPNPLYTTAKQGLPQISTDHLKEFNHPFIDKFLKWDKLYKVYSSYLQALATGDSIHPDNRIYPSTLLTRTVTGRTVILNPPMQTFPQHSEFARLIKEPLVADDGWVMGARDLSQSEFRIIGWLSQDPVVLDAIAHKIDIHTVTAAKVLLNTTIEAVTSEARKHAKVLNFGLIYGMGPDGLQAYAKQNYGIEYPIAECYEKRIKFFKTYNKFIDYYHSIEAEILQTGEVVGVLGRKRRFPSCKGNSYALGKITDQGITGGNLRQGINFKVQNFSSDLALLGMMLFQRVINKLNLNHVIKLLWFIHDSIIFQAREDYLTKAMSLMDTCLKQLAPEYIQKYFGVTVGYPIDSDGKIGINWNELK